MTATLNDAYINALLADASYVDGLAIDMTGALLANQISGRMTPALARYIGSNFTVLDVAAGLSSSFEAVVWRGNVGTSFAGQTFISFRGTQEGPDFTDADPDLASSGLAHRQLADMVNWWLRETTPARYPDGDPVFVRQVKLTTDNDFVLGDLVPAAGSLAGLTSAKSVNGHSLGGYLATSFARIFGAKWPIETVNTFNSAGFSKLATSNIDLAFSRIASAIGPEFSLETFSHSQNNYFALNGINVTTNTWDPVGFQQYGVRVGLFQEDLTSEVINNHYMYKLTDLLSLGNVLAQLDPTLDFERLSAIVRAGSNRMIASYEGVLDGLRMALLGRGTELSQMGDANGSNFGQPDARVNFHANIEMLLKGSAFQALIGKVTIGVASQGLRTRAHNDFGALVALQDLSPIVIAAKNPALELDINDFWQSSRTVDYTTWLAERGGTPARFTDEWIADRAAMLTALMRYNVADATGNLISAGGATQTAKNIYIDLTTGRTLTETSNGSLPSRFVKFGGSGNDPLLGESLDDHLYGGEGNDHLSGQMGGDYLQGDGGNDSLLGGVGNDTMAGGAGDDSLEGGENDDSLMGGADNDTYVMSGSWGKDSLIDSDGSGRIMLNGWRLIGGTGIGAPGAEWQEELPDDQKVRYLLLESKASTTGKQLQITVQGDAANSITINNFDFAAAKSGTYLGIHLDDTPKVALVQGSGPSFWGDVNANLQALVGRATDIIEGAATTFMLNLKTAAKAAESFVFHLFGLEDKSVKVVVGDRVIDADGATIALAEGQTQVSFALIQDGGLDADVVGSLSVDYMGAGGKLATSNSWGLSLHDAPDPASIITGDFTKKIVNNKFVFQPEQPAEGQYNYAVDEDNPNSPNAADLISGFDEAEKILGLGGNDALLGRGGADSIDGGDGNDILQGGLGADTLIGGEGNDIIYGSSTGWLWTTDTPGREAPYVPSGESLLWAGFGWSLTTNGSTNLTGEPSGRLENTVARDEQFDDVGNVIESGAGNDHVYAGVADDRVEAGDGKDIVYGSIGNDLVLGQEGNDYLFGDGQSKRANISVDYAPAAQHGQDFLDGGEGDDTLVGQGNNDVLYGGVGSDQLWGDSGSFMSSDWEYLDAAFHGNDYLDGEDGDDSLIGQGGADTLYGGIGNDMLQGDDNSTARVPGDKQGNDLMDGEDGDDTLFGGGAADTLYGGAGNDLMRGDDNALEAKFHGADYIDAEDGADTVVGGGGADTIYGGAGNDRLSGDGGTSGQADFAAQFYGADYIDAEDGEDYVVAGGSADTVYGGAGNDTIFGDANGATGSREGSDYLDGEGGDDQIAAGGGNDTVIGGVGNDVLQGDEGDDWIEGGDGDDTLQAGGGSDTLIGGDGANVFVIDKKAAGNITIESESELDAVVFQDGIVAGSITGVVEGDTMQIQVGTGQTVTVGANVGAFQFADNSTMSAAAMAAYLQAHPPAPPPPAPAPPPSGTTTTTTNLTDSNGNPAGSSVTVATPTQTTTTIFSGPNGTGAKLSDTWTTAAGGHGSNTYNTDGSSSGIAYNLDGTHTSYTDSGQGDRTDETFDAGGFKTTVTWNHADGSRGNDRFSLDGSSTGVTYHANETYETYTDDGRGHVTVLSFDSHGKLLGTEIDGRTYPSTEETDYPDGGHRVVMWNAPGEMTSTIYGTDGKKTSVSWSKADGTHGSETYLLDGSSTTTAWRADGSYEMRENNGVGKLRVIQFGSAGEVLGSSVQQTDGLNRITTFYGPDGSTVNQEWAHPGGGTGSLTVDPEDFNGVVNYLEATEARNLPYYQAWDAADGSAGLREEHEREFIATSWFINYVPSGQLGMGDYDGEFHTMDNGVQGALLNAWWQLWAGKTASFFDTQYYVLSYWDAPSERDGSSPEVGDYYIRDYYLDASITVTLRSSGQKDIDIRRVGTQYDPGRLTIVGGASTAYSRLISAFNGSGNYDVFEDDGAGNMRLVTYNAVKTKIADVWFHNDGSYGSDTYNADGSMTGVSANPEGHYVKFSRNAQGVLTVANYPDATGHLVVETYKPPPVALPPAPPAPVPGLVPSGGTAQHTSHTYTPDDWYFEITHRPTENPCDQEHILYNSDGTILSRTKIHTDPGYEVSVNVGSTRVGSAYDVRGRVTSRFTDDGQGTVTTLQLDAQGHISQREVVLTTVDGGITTSRYSASGALLGYDTRAAGSRRVDHFDAAGRYSGYDESIGDGDGNAMGTRYDAEDSLLGYTATVVSQSGRVITATTYDAVGSVMGTNITSSDADGVVQTDMYDAQGHLKGSVVATPREDGDIETVNYDATGKIVDYVTLHTDAQRTIILTTFDGQGIKLREDRHIADGTQVLTEFTGDGSNSATTWAVDGSWSVAAVDAQGNTITTQFSDLGVKRSDSWTRTDGSHGSDTFALDGSATGEATYADGSTGTFATDTTGKQTATYRDADGDIVGTGTTFKLTDRTETARYDAAGKLLSDRWWANDGSWGFTNWTNADDIVTEEHAPDGSYTVSNERRGNTVTTSYDAAGRKQTGSWTNTDGSFGSDTYHPDGGRTGIATTTEGNLQKVTTSEIDASGHVVSDTWTLSDGSYGSDTFNADGSGSGEGHFLDGSYTDITYYGPGDFRTYKYSAAGDNTLDEYQGPDGSWWRWEGTFDSTGFMTGDTYSDSDGYWWFDVYNPDGSYYGEDHGPDYWRKYSGDEHSEAWEKSDGTHGTKSWTATSSTETTFRADGSYETYFFSAGEGRWARTQFAADGAKLSATWQDGATSGTDVFYADGSSSGTATNGNDGTGTRYIDDGLGDRTTTSLNASGVATGDSWVRADGSHGTTTFNADGTISGTRVAADGTVTNYTNQSHAVSVAAPIADQAAHERANWSYTVSADTFFEADPGDMFVYTATLANGSALPGWLTFDARSHTFSGTPPTGSHDNLAIKVSVTNGANQTASDVFVLAITDGNSAPVAAQTIQAQNATEDQPWTFAVAADTFTDVDTGDTMTYSAQLANGVPLPAWLSFDAATCTFSGTPANGDVGTLSVKLIATDSVGASGSTTFSLAVPNANDAPTVAQAIAIQSATEDSTWSFAVPTGTFNDVDASDVLTYGASLADGSALPSWISFDSTSRTFSGTPGAGDIGSLSIKVTATDAAGAAVSTAFTLSVNHVNHAPVVTQPIGAQMATEDSAWSLVVPASTFSDADGETLVFGALLADGTALPSWLTFDAAARTFSGTPVNGNVGALNVRLTGTDAAGASASTTFALVVQNTNDAPVLVQPIPDQGAAEDSLWTFPTAGAFSDVDTGDSLTFAATLQDGSALPSWLSFNASTGVLSGTPGNGDVGSLVIKVAATDAAGASVSTTFNLLVSNTNDAPTVIQSIPAQSATEDQPWTYTVAAGAFADVDVGDSLTYSARLANGSALPGWLAFDAATRTFSGTPANAQVGAQSVTVMATDAAGAVAAIDFLLTVADVNDAPTVVATIGDKTVDEDSNWTFAVPASTFGDVDAGDTLTLSASLADGQALPSWLSFNASTRTFSGVPANGDVGSLSVRITATDAVGASVSTTFAVTVRNVNDAPFAVGSIEAQAATEGQAWTYSVDASAFADVDANDVLTYSAVIPAEDASWLSFDPTTRTFSGTPGHVQGGPRTITVKATDSAGAVAATTFDLSVTLLNVAPVVANTIDDVQIDEDGAWTFAVPSSTFSDADVGDTLTYVATMVDGSALPSWLAFNVATHTFSGTPANENVGTLGITVTATDTAGESVGTSFDLTVRNVNDAPVSAGISTQTAYEDALWTFTVPASTFSDVDPGDTLVYGASRGTGAGLFLPSWLSFDPQTRTFSGTPAQADVGDLTVTVRAYDTSGAWAAATFTVAVQNTNDAPHPLQGISSVNTKEDQAFNYTFAAGAFTDPDPNDVLSYSAKRSDGSALPSWLSFNAASRTFSGTPVNDDVGVVGIKVTATDLAGASTHTSFNITVENTNDAPEAVTILPQSVDEDSPWTFYIPAFKDVDQGSQLSYTVKQESGASLPGWLTFVSNEHKLVGTPTNAYVGPLSLKVTADDGRGGSASTVFSVTVNNVNDAPTAVGTLANWSALAGSSASYMFAATAFKDVDVGDSLTYTATRTDGSPIPSWITFNAATRTFTGTPGLGDGGDFGLKITATDKSGLSASQALQLHVDTSQNLVGTAGNDSLVGAGGNDTLDGMAGADTMRGGAGDDTYYVDNAGDVVTENANEGFDTVNTSLTYVLGANVEKLVLTGSNNRNGTGNELNNVLIGNSGGNSLQGGAGNDTLDGGGGADTLKGGAGDDLYYVYGGAGTITEQAGEGVDTVASFNSWSLGLNFENLLLTGTGDVDGTGNALVNVITGNAGANVLKGGDGDDTLYGGAGNDDLRGEAGSDAMLGGQGDDTYEVKDATDVVTEFAGEGIDTVTSYINYTLGANLENLDSRSGSGAWVGGNQLNNLLSGHSGNDTLQGAGGDDTLDGEGGVDTLAGGTGNDVYLVDTTTDTITENADEGVDSVQTKFTFTLAANVENLLILESSSGANGTGNASDNALTGSSQNNKFSGLAGNDTLNGGAGSDDLTGGTGNDTYVMARGYGNDNIIENDSTAGNTDVAVFGPDIASSQLWFRQRNMDLEVMVIGTNDRFLITNWYGGNQFHVEQFRTGDSKMLLDSQVQNLVNAMAGFNPPAGGQTTLPPGYESVAQAIAANWS
ncbi:putative Ig domain-containing protein [Ramlibacter sp. PS4R-6]|uniref:putative Ig domain-containing protein n=1 Tax=Ramlibacter sp. PS4R-6 TaxID=3133438 RepID=UPI0030B5EC3F